MIPMEQKIAEFLADAIESGRPSEEDADVVIDNVTADGDKITFYADGEPYKLTVTWDGGEE
jgi:hypothetical protein